MRTTALHRFARYYATIFFKEVQHTDHERWPICEAPRDVSLHDEAGQWRHEILRTWADRADLTIEADFVLVEPDPVDEVDPVAVHLIVIQRPLEAARGVLVSVMDNAIWNGVPRRWALRSSLDPTGLELVALMGYLQLCPPFVLQTECRVWCRGQEIGMEDRVMVRHGLALTVTVLRQFDDPNDLEDDEFNLLQRLPPPGPPSPAPVPVDPEPEHGIKISFQKIRLYTDGSFARASADHPSAAGAAVAAFVCTSFGWQFAGAMSSALPTAASAYVAEFAGITAEVKFAYDLVKIHWWRFGSVPLVTVCYDASTVGNQAAGHWQCVSHPRLGRLLRCPLSIGY
eukprot:s605_g18.t1